jgi:hypothetical protein
MKRSYFALGAALLLTFGSTVRAQSEWRPDILPVTLQVGYAVRIADINRDNKPDIVIVDAKRILWLENPTWKLHEIYSTPDAKFDNVCIAIHDVDNDGRLDMAVGSDWQFGNSDSGGQIGLLFSGEDPTQPWTYREIGTEPTTHRMVWADLDGNGQQELIVAPLKGRGTRPPELTQHGIRLLRYEIPQNPRTAKWEPSVITDTLRVMHNLDVVDFDKNGKHEIVTASFEGLTLIRQEHDQPASMLHIGSGQLGKAPTIGSSEVKVWQEAQPGSRMAATIEPWHGDKVVVYAEVESKNPTDTEVLWDRTEVDTELKWGHAVAWSDFDHDGTPELVAGVRDDQNASHRCGVRLYKQVEGRWQRQLIEPGQVAVEDLVTADLNQDGQDEIIAVGRATHNAVIYWKK